MVYNCIKGTYTHLLYGIEDGILKESTADRLQDKIQTDKIQTAKLLARIGQKQTNSIFWSRLQFFRLRILPICVLSWSPRITCYRFLNASCSKLVLVVVAHVIFLLTTVIAVIARKNTFFFSFVI